MNQLLSHVAAVVKNRPTNAGAVASVPGLEDSLEVGTATQSSILDWRIP